MPQLYSYPFSILQFLFATLKCDFLFLKMVAILKELYIVCSIVCVCTYAV